MLIVLELAAPERKFNQMIKSYTNDIIFVTPRSFHFQKGFLDNLLQSNAY